MPSQWIPCCYLKSRVEMLQIRVFELPALLQGHAANITSTGSPIGRAASYSYHPLRVITELLTLALLAMK